MNANAGDCKNVERMNVVYYNPTISVLAVVSKMLSLNWDRMRYNAAVFKSMWTFCNCACMLSLQLFTLLLGEQFRKPQVERYIGQFNEDINQAKLVTITNYLTRIQYSLWYLHEQTRTKYGNTVEWMRWNTSPHFGHAMTRAMLWLCSVIGSTSMLCHAWCEF